MIGQTISHYKILEKLGEGGMGVVYKAHDTRLDRDVALKFLPEHLITHEPERARFFQEARAASALNHPHICTIHAIEECGEQQFIVMEYVEGKTLRETLQDGGLKIEDCMRYAIQIGEALQEAHSHGIVHRDVKPDNIMVTATHQIKVMDFGLAKLKGSLKLTRTSSTVGTLAYMAPEQLQSGEVDARGDTFSFGIVLYEMLTGHLPFHGEHEAAMMYSIVNEDPASVSAYRPDLSPELDRIIHRALEKDPEDRYQSVADMVSELRKVLKQSTKVVHTSALHAAIPGAGTTRELHENVADPRHGRPKALVLSAIGLAVILVAALMYFLVVRPRSVELNPDMTFRTLQISFSQISYPSLSADGNWIAFPAADINGKWDIYYMNVAVGEPRRVTFDSSANPFGNVADISPDGGVIAYDRYNAKRNVYDAYVVPSIGGRSKRVAERSRSPRWRQDGGRIGYMNAAERGLSIWSVTPDGSDRRLEIRDTLTSDWGRVDFDWSPAGTSIVWLRSFPEGHQEIVRGDLESGRETQLTHGRSNIDEVCWTSNDQIIYSSNRSGNTNLWMVPASGGGSVQITKGSGPDIGMSVSADGRRLLYLQSQEAGHLWRSSTDGRTIRQLTTDERSISWPSFSPDGRQIAFGMSDNDPLKPTRHIYVCDRDGNNRRQISTGDEWANWPTWSPDGRWISFYRMESDQPSDSGVVHIVDPADPGPPRPLGRGLYSRWLDTTTLVIANPFRDKASIITLDGTSRSMAYQDSAILWPILDGRHVLLRDHHTGREGWYVVAARNHRVVEGAKPKKLFTRGYPPNLSPDRRHFYFCAEPEILRRVSLPAGGEERNPGTFPGLSTLFSISSDGREIVYSDSRVNAKLVLVENLFR